MAHRYDEIERLYAAGLMIMLLVMPPGAARRKVAGELLGLDGRPHETPERGPADPAEPLG